MKKTLFLAVALFLALSAAAQQNDCYISFKYDASGNRVHRSYNCELPPEMQTISAPYNGTGQDDEAAQTIDAGSYSIVYPNPNSGKFWVEFNNQGTQDSKPIKRRIYLLNNLGQVVLELESAEQKVYIEAEALTAGSYFVTIYDGIRNTSHKITIVK